MKVVDANVLLYAVDESAPRHVEAHRWLTGALRGGETVGFAWIVLLAFLRLSTHQTLQTHPLSVEAALDIAEGWLSRPNAVVLEPASMHLASMRAALAGTGTGGNLVNDAHLAALAHEHGATVVSYDNDFTRFAGVRWQMPS